MLTVFLLSVVNKPFILSVIMMNVIMLNVILLNVILLKVILLNSTVLPLTTEVCSSMHKIKS